MRDYFELDPCPWEESGAQVGHDDKFTLAAEARRFAHQIRQAYPLPNSRCHVDVHWQSHELGSYPEIRVKFDTSDPEGEAWAMTVEADPDDKLRRWAD
jgi:hypothetical protein